MPAQQRVAVAADVVQGAGGDRAALPELCAAAAELTVATADAAGGVLEPSSVFSVLSNAVAATGPTAAYAEAVAAGPDLVAALMAHAAPSELTRVASGLHDAVLLRFGQEDALSAVAFHAALRVLGPALAADRQQALAASVEADGGPGRTALDRYARMLVAAGYAAEAAFSGDEDPDDLTVQRGAVLEDADTLAAAFAKPTPADPLGTCPALPITVLGQAILAARRGRDPDVSWAALEAMRQAAPEDYETVLLDERSKVLDAIPLPD